MQDESLAWGQPDSPWTFEQTKFLTNTEGAYVADYFNGNVLSWGQVYRDYDRREETEDHVYFLAWVSHDQFLELEQGRKAGCARSCRHLVWQKSLRSQHGRFALPRH